MVASRAAWVTALRRVKNPQRGRTPARGAHSLCQKSAGPAFLLQWKLVGRRAKAGILILALAGFGLRAATPLVMRGATRACCSSESCCRGGMCPMHGESHQPTNAGHSCHAAKATSTSMCMCSVQNDAPASPLAGAPTEFWMQLPTSSRTPELAAGGQLCPPPVPDGLAGHSPLPDHPPRLQA